jgi:hypothetical protein
MRCFSGCLRASTHLPGKRVLKPVKHAWSRRQDLPADGRECSRVSKAVRVRRVGGMEELPLALRAELTRKQGAMS